MADQDQLLRAYALLSSMKSNVPDTYEVSQSWVEEFNTSVEKIERTLGSELSEFKIRDHELKQSVASSNYVTGEVRYRKGLWCNRAALMLKVDAVLNYLQALRGSQG